MEKLGTWWCGTRYNYQRWCNNRCLLCLIEGWNWYPTLAVFVPPIPTTIRRIRGGRNPVPNCLVQCPRHERLRLVKDIGSFIVDEPNARETKANAVIIRGLKPSATQPKVIGQKFVPTSFLLIWYDENAQHNGFGRNFSEVGHEFLIRSHADIGGDGMCHHGIVRAPRLILFVG